MGVLFKRAVVTLAIALSATWLAHAYEGLILERAELDAMLARMDALADRLDALDAPPPAPTPTPTPTPRERLDPERVYPVNTDGYSRGPVDAPVVVVEYVDLQCPFCARAQGTLQLLQEKYPEDVRVVFKHNPLPFHKDARPAARALECAGEQGRFWDYQDRLWDNTRALSSEDLSRYADQLELDLRRFETCLASERPDVAVDRQMGEAKELGARGTPTFFINGRPLVGAQPLSRFIERVEAELDGALAN